MDFKNGTLKAPSHCIESSKADVKFIHQFQEIKFFVKSTLFIPLR
jgi:hypothetical protein